MQARYKLLIDQHISPRLRAKGLTGSGGRYQLPSASHWSLLGFQKSAYSDRSSVKFTVSVTVVSRAEWDERVAEKRHAGKRPSALTRYNGIDSGSRIGALAGIEDKWWLIEEDTDINALAIEVLGLIDTFALPWLRANTPD